MSRPKTIWRTTEDVCEGIRYELEYSKRARNVQVIPDDATMRAADVLEVLRFWEKIAAWASRFRAANPDWTVDGRTEADEANALHPE